MLFFLNILLLNVLRCCLQLFCKVLLELKALNTKRVALARSSSEEINNEDSLFLSVKPIIAKGHKKLFCSFISEKDEYRGDSELCHINWCIILLNIDPPTQWPKVQPVDKKGAYLINI
jgi:hypothetical protein